MPDGVNTLFNCQGKVNASNALEVVTVAVTLPLGPLTPIAQLPCRVDANNKLVVTEG